MSAIRTAFPALVAATLASVASADVLTLNLTPAGGVYGPGEQVTMTLTGPSGSLALVGFDTDPGPTLVPPYGTFQLGFSSSFRLLEPALVLTGGQAAISCGFDCDQLVVGVMFYTQAISIDPLTLETCISNGATMSWDDPTGTCDCQASIGDYVFQDVDGDNLQSAGDLAIGGIDVVLRDASGVEVARTTTASDGSYLFDDLCAGTYSIVYDPLTVDSTLGPVLCDQGTDDAVDGDCAPSLAVLANDTVDLSHDFGFATCSECDGKVTALTMRYDGAAAAQIDVHAENVVFSGIVAPGETFTFFGDDGSGTLGKEIEIDKDGVEVEQVHTSCSKPVGPGTVFGEFTVLAGTSRDGGPMCDESGNVCADGGKPQSLTMLFNGGDCSVLSHSQDPGKVGCTGDSAMTSPARIVAYDGGDVWFDGMVNVGETFLIDAGLAGDDKLGSNTDVDVYDAAGTLIQSINFHTSCSQDLFVGDQFGSIVLLDFTLDD